MTPALFVSVAVQLYCDTSMYDSKDKVLLLVFKRTFIFVMLIIDQWHHLVLFIEMCEYSFLIINDMSVVTCAEQWWKSVLFFRIDNVPSFKLDYQFWINFLKLIWMFSLLHNDMHLIIKYICSKIFNHIKYAKWYEMMMFSPFMML